MATYSDLRPLLTDSDLLNKTMVAIGVAADTIRTELVSTPNHDERLKWAKRVFENPKLHAQQMLWAIVIANRAATVAGIQGASDAAIQTNVDDFVDVFAQAATP